MRRAYDTVATTYASTIPGLSAESPLEVAFLDRFAEELAATGGRVADVGCGPGRITAYLASRGVNVFGLDLSPQMIEVAATSYPDLLFEVGTMTELPSVDGEVGGVLAWYSTIHTPPDELDAVLSREPVGREPRQQGFVLAHKA